MKKKTHKFKNILIAIIVIFFLLGLINSLRPCRVRPEYTLSGDYCNLKQNLLAAVLYKDNKGYFPERLSTLLTNEYIPMSEDWQGLLNADRVGASNYKPYEGPFLKDFSNPPDNYPPTRFIATPFEADINCDYLYLKPLPQYTNKTIIMMSRPGVLYQNQVHVGYAGGNVELLNAKVWQKRKDVLVFLDRWIKQRDKDLNRHSNSKWIFQNSKFPAFFNGKKAPDWDKRYTELIEEYKPKFIPPRIGMETTFYTNGYTGYYAKLVGVKEKYAEIESDGNISKWEISEFRKDLRLKLFEMEFAKDRANIALFREKAQYKYFLEQRQNKKASFKGIKIDYYVYRKNEEIHITGTIKNGSNKLIKAIQAKINFYTEDGGNIKTYKEKNILHLQASSTQIINFHIKKVDIPKAVKVYIEFKIEETDNENI